MAEPRLPAADGELIDRDRIVTFRYEGRNVRAYEGDTIASALYADGMRTFSRSFKYHRPRGLLCCSGRCPNCLVAVDDAPAERACATPVREGMEVAHINAWPSLRHDLLALPGRVGGPLLQVGFYYKTFLRPRRLWPLYERVLRGAAGLGRIDPDHRRAAPAVKIHRHVDVLVIGGGTSGLSAAIEAATDGRDVTLVDDGLQLGGDAAYGDEAQRTVVRSLVEEARARGVELMSGAYAGGVYEGRLVPVFVGETMHRFRADELVLATGAIEQPLVFAGNDLPGVMLCDAVRRLVRQHGIAPGRTVAVATATADGVEAALDLRAAGVAVAAVVDLREAAPDARLAAAGIEHLCGWAIGRATGRRHVTGVRVERGGERRRIACDVLAMSGGRVPQTGLLAQAGGSVRFDAERQAFVADVVPEGVRVAGGLTDATVAPPVSACGGGKQFVCFCEDVTTKDVAFAADEGFDSLELSKRYTTVTMGPCQGRMCHRNAGLALAGTLGVAPDAQQIGVTTSRPPHRPTTMTALAGPAWEPAKRTPLHHRHVAHGGDLRWAGDWLRPYDYGDAATEVEAVHERLGLIDVSSLGKLIVRGPDAVEFLERVYPNRFGTMNADRVRYGVICGEDGAILDDGTVARLADDAFYVTTTSSGAGAVERWFLWWNAIWGLDVEIVDVTATVAAVNLAGPKAREALSTLTDQPLDNDALPYLGAVRADVAGIPCLLLRIGFVGELGYELHVPAAAAESLWDLLLEAGEPHGVRPFGLEPQRVLRLEKGHVIVGQDTDAESNPFEAAMPWIVKLDKDGDFVGRASLEYLSERPKRLVLAGWVAANGDVPREGAQLVGPGGELRGRITSARFSARLGRAIGLGWLPAGDAEEGASVRISDPSGRTIPATITHAAFYDPEGRRLRA